MGNSFNEATMIWKVDSTGAASAVAGFTSSSWLTVGDVVYHPNANGDDLIFQDGTASEDAIVVKGNAADTDPVVISFRPQGKKVRNLKCTTIDGGTAYVQLL